MLDPFLSHELAVGRDHRGQRVVLVRVERDIFHRRRLLSRLNTAEYLPRTRSPRRVGGAALTSHQRDSNPCFGRGHVFAGSTGCFSALRSAACKLDGREARLVPKGTREDEGVGWGVPPRGNALPPPPPPAPIARAALVDDPV